MTFLVDLKCYNYIRKENIGMEKEIILALIALVSTIVTSVFALIKHIVDKSSKIKEEELKNKHEEEILKIQKQNTPTTTLKACQHCQRV